MKLSTNLFLALIVMGCGVGNHRVTGTFVLNDEDIDRTSVYCQGTGGYSDIRAGTDVVIKDGENAIIATTELRDDPGTVSADSCTYTFAVDVPDAEFYTVSVGHRGELTYSKDELAAQGWDVGFTLGGD